MAPSFIPLESYKKKLYQREVDSKKFFGLSEEQVAEVAKKVYKKQEMTTEVPKYGILRSIKLERYENALKYLTSPLVHLELRSFDEKMAYLIMMFDPELWLFKEFLKIDLMSEADILKIEDANERCRLFRLRKQSLAMYETRVREKLGFYDPKLLKYEELFFKRFYSEKELITEVGNINQDNLIVRAKALPNFNSVTDERYQELMDVAQGWLAVAPEKFNSKVAAYSVINQKKLLGLKSLAEQLTLYVLLVDSDLDMLRIYEEESRMPNVERRIIEEFGYYNPELLNLEKKFHKRFCPTKELSIWTKVKKD